MASLAKKVFRVLGRDVRAAFREVGRFFTCHGVLLLASALGLTLFIALFIPLDALIIERISDFNATNVELQGVAKHISYFGDFLGFNLVLFVTLQAAGWSLRSRQLLRIAVASLLCAVFAGASANVARLFTGRPRPYVMVEDRLTGPTLATAYQALPSAHTATAFGGALPLLLSKPVIGIPAVIFAGTVGWSRMQLNRHHLTDVLASTAIALLFSLPLSRWAVKGGTARAVKAQPNVLPPYAVAAPRMPC